jgi:glycosyltransferase involved in cell wall biosynthesis
MATEYEFAKRHLPVVASHKFFFYENQLPYEKLDSFVVPVHQNETLVLIIGNSGSPENNHLDVIRFLDENRIKAHLLIPVSYGDSGYIKFLKKTASYSCGKIEFVDRYMPFDEYLNFLGRADALVMNTLRPQGYGNILMMMYIGKPVVFNERNISLTDINEAGLTWFKLDDLKSYKVLKKVAANKEAVMNLFSHARLLKEYQLLFS